MNVIVHKPLANRVLEARAVIEAARAAKIATHFMPASEGAGQKQALEMVQNGAIGSCARSTTGPMRPMWPQFPTIPTDTPPVPAGFDWTLWLGPSLDRPYHPATLTPTSAAGTSSAAGPSPTWVTTASGRSFRCSISRLPISVESTPSHVCTDRDEVCFRIKNDYSFPVACTIRMRFAAKGGRPALDIFWYDGGIKPPVPEELMAEDKELAEEGMLFVGDKGKILGGFRAENPQLIPDEKMRAYRAANNIPDPAPPERRQSGDQDNRPRVSARDRRGLTRSRAGRAATGTSMLAGPICDAIGLAAISLRLGGRRLLWDAAAAKITNVPEGNRLLTRDYREGWKI